MSLGAYGTIDFVATYPKRVAAAMAFCGGGSVKDYSGLCSVPLWIIHGTADQVVSVGQSRKVVNAMKLAGDTSLLRYDEWEGVNHSRLARMFYIPEVYDWLLCHSLTDSPRQVDKTIIITNETLNNAYKGLKLASWNKK
jgi:predicted peptidase